MLFNVLESVMELHGLGPDLKPLKTNYDISLNREQLFKDLLALGFTSIKMWYQPLNYPLTDWKDYYNTIFLQPTPAAKLKNLSQE